MAQDISNFIDPKLILSIERLNKGIGITGDKLDALIPKMNTFNQVTAETAKNINADAEAQKKLTEAKKQADTIEKQIIANEEKIKNLSTERNVILAETKIKLQQATQAQKDKLKAEQAARGFISQDAPKVKRTYT